jgi:hypothetical protein
MRNYGMSLRILTHRDVCQKPWNSDSSLTSCGSQQFIWPFYPCFFTFKMEHRIYSWLLFFVMKSLLWGLNELIFEKCFDQYQAYSKHYMCSLSEIKLPSPGIWGGSSELLGPHETVCFLVWGGCSVSWHRGSQCHVSGYLYQVGIAMDSCVGGYRISGKLKKLSAHCMSSLWFQLCR